MKFRFFYINRLVFILSLVLILSPFLSLLPFFPLEILTGGACQPFKICDTIGAHYILLPLLVIVLISGIIVAAKAKRLGFCLLIVISFIVIAGLILISLGSARCKSWNARRNADLRQILIAQEMFFGEHAKYASSFEELKEFLNVVPVDPRSKEVYTDADGNGLEGGDTDPATWSVQALIDRPQYKYCMRVSSGYWFICDQDGCKHEYNKVE